MRTRGGRPVEHFFAPVVPNARYTVTCTCGYATDSDAVDEYAAVGEVAQRHLHAHVDGQYRLTVVPIATKEN